MFKSHVPNLRARPVQAELKAKRALAVITEGLPGATVYVRDNALLK
jgi:hypothetical protein